MPSASSSKAAKTRTVRRTLADGTVREYTYANKKVADPTGYAPHSVAALMLAYSYLSINASAPG